MVLPDSGNILNIFAIILLINLLCISIKSLCISGKLPSKYVVLFSMIFSMISSIMLAILMSKCDLANMISDLHPIFLLVLAGVQSELLSHLAWLGLEVCELKPIMHCSGVTPFQSTSPTTSTPTSYYMDQVTPPGAGSSGSSSSSGHTNVLPHVWPDATPQNLVHTQLEVARYIQDRNRDISELKTLGDKFKASYDKHY